jgi:diaminopimelate decarboxylase
MKICVSGLYSGTNPQPGIGVARSLRAAYPNATLIGIEYSNRCSGIHWKDFDDVLLQPQWEHIDLDTYAHDVEELLGNGALWISGVDLEIMWLASVFPNGHSNLLTPPADALRKISKPAVEAHRGLPVRIPDFISTEESDWSLHAFCRQHGWKVWLKGPFYEAVRTSTWDAFERVRNVLSNAWSTERLFLQAHVTGYEESICFCAYRGELLEAVYMRKRELTEEGKTWAGEVVDLPEELAQPLRKIVGDLNWTGGAELEMVRDPGGNLWLLECNPRFPAWIYGATITGRNLPAMMVERASGNRSKRVESTTDEFTRVVLEIPLREEFPLPGLAEPYPGGIGHSLKHPSGTLVLAQRLQKLRIIEGNANNEADVSDKRMIKVSAAKNDGNGIEHNNSNGSNNGNGSFPKAPKLLSRPEIPSTFIADLKNLDLEHTPTPSWLFFETTAEALFARASELAKKLSTAGLRVTNGYSIKTNPDKRLIRLARDAGFLAESISLTEVQKALEVGYRPEQVVLNGPGKWWPPMALPQSAIHAVFADSFADFARLIESLESGELLTKIVGARVRPPGTGSRFGISVETPDELTNLVEMIQTLPRKYELGIHFHMASSNIGVRQWWHLFESMLTWCRSIQQLSQRPIECLDIGGGWFPDDWHLASPETFESAIVRAKRRLPDLREIISEPGKAVAQPTVALAMRLLELDDSQSEIKEAVVDGSIAELPMHYVQPHRILHRNADGDWTPLRRGKTRLLGRLCMEHDIVAANVELPAQVQKGDVLVFCDAGAYDRSMSYDFGRG